MNLTSLADLKRAMPVGTVVDVVNHRFPELSGERRVVRARTKQWCLSFPTAHPKYDPANPDDGSWLDIPPRNRVTFEGNTAVISRDPNWGDSGPFVTITIREG